MRFGRNFPGRSVFVGCLRIFSVRRCNIGKRENPPETRDYYTVFAASFEIPSGQASGRCAVPIEIPLFRSVRNCELVDASICAEIILLTDIKRSNTTLSDIQNARRSVPRSFGGVKQ